MRFTFSVVSIFLICVTLWSRPASFFRIEHQDNQSLIVAFEFPEPEIDHAGDYSLVTIEGLSFNFEEGKPLLPVYSTSLAVPGSGATWKIIESQKKIIQSPRPALYYSETDTVNAAPLDYPFTTFPSNIIRLSDAGIYRDFHLMGLTLFPVQWSAQGLVFYSKIRIRIQFEGSIQPAAANVSVNERKLLDKIVLNSATALPYSGISTPPEENLPLSFSQIPFNQKVKLIVDKFGIYRVTGQDLLDAGILIDEIDPQSFRMTSRSNDVALYISGEQDGRFDEGDYIEFLGERNQKTFIDQYPDMFSDPFSDDNVYWLSWGGSPGVRMIEESGAAITTNPIQYNRARYYPYTVHLEKDNYFARFGNGNTGKLSHTRDHWFFDFGIIAVSKKSYPVTILYPDSTPPARPVNIRMAFAGNSMVSHNLMAWLNNRLVGEVSSGWYGENVYMLDNSASPGVTGFDLFHGTNTIEIQIPRSPLTGANDIVLFNWADITYDRQYKAVNNYIEFSKPSSSGILFPDVNLFQFEITNFTRPDIEIYKKGISKIVNYGLAVEGEGQNVRYKITFQDEIFSDDVQYVAVAGNSKLKPTAIIPEKPFDEDNPLRTLRDPSNSADYLIITHEKFYERALDLAQLRRDRGLNVVTVKVQDIYDEFNYGIKSPLAIQQFLRYAFYNWERSHRLKYLLLVGDAYYNYKFSGEVNADYVPTYFYQSTKFGAVATDLPYALISGEDDLPDIFVGRLPITTNGELINIIEKIREHEETPVIDEWRNQTLFISGNDRSTYEFSQLSYVPRKPAFRTQNQRVIDMLLDKNFSSFKLNTIRDTSLVFDPNFGGTTDLIDYFDNGVGFVNFLGHGGGGIWADVQLMNLQDVERLNNKGKYPFITSMTCFTGGFDNPGSPGLAQRLVSVPDRGAIGVLASSGLGWLANDYSMLWNVMKNFFRDDISIGEATTLGKIDYFIASQYVLSDTIISGGAWGHGSLKYDMIHQYNLIGDPYVSIGKPPDGISVSVDNDLPLPGDTVIVTLQAPFATAEGYIELADGSNNIISREPVFYSGNSSPYDLVIPMDYTRGAGFIRAYLTDNNIDAAGHKQIGVNFSVFDSVVTIPAQPNAEDSVQISLLAKDKSGIADVRIVAILPENAQSGDTVHLSTVETEPGRFITEDKIPPTRTLSTVYYFVYSDNNQGQQSRLSFSYDVIDLRPDPYIFPESARLTGPDKVNLAVSFGNGGNFPARDIKIHVYQGLTSYMNQQPFSSSSVTIDSKDSLSVIFDFPFDTDTSSYRIYASIDPSGQSPDFNRLNNTDSFLVAVNVFHMTPALGTTYDDAQNDSIRIGKTHKFWLGPGSISGPSAVRLSLTEFNNDWTNDKLIFIPLADSGQPSAIHVQKLNKSAQFMSPFVLSISLDSTFLTAGSYDEQDIRLYRFDEQMKAWLQQESEFDLATNKIRSGLLRDGIYAPFISGDKKAPEIKLTIEGQRVQTNFLVAPTPALNILIEDESGIDINRDQLVLAIDEQPMAPEQVFIPDSVQQSNVLGIMAYPELSLGKHTLTVEARDVNGNVSRKNYTLQVSTEFELHVFGNYPNPFSDETVFSYFLTNQGQMIDDLEIRIFTVSGRLIRVIKNDRNTSVPGNDPRLVGYNELIWDGRDDYGNDVANGVYFALVRARFEEKEQQQILKVAKLRQ